MVARIIKWPGFTCPGNAAASFKLLRRILDSQGPVTNTGRNWGIVSAYDDGDFEKIFYLSESKRNLALDLLILL